MKDRVQAILDRVAEDYMFSTASVYVFEPGPDNNFFVLAKRVKAEADKGKNLPPVYFRQVPVDSNSSMAGPALQAAHGDANSVRMVDDEKKAWVVGFAPLRETFKTGSNEQHFGVIVAVLQSDAYATIDNLQMITAIIFTVAAICVVLAGFWAGRQFVTPIEHIMEITKSLQEGHLDMKTEVDRRDELGKLGEQVNSVIAKLGNVVGQIRVATGSVSTASHQLNASAQGLSQGATEQAGTLQEIASSLQNVDASVARNAQHAKETAKAANQASAQAEKGGEAVHETVTAMRQIAQKITIVEDIAYQTNLWHSMPRSRLHELGRKARVSRSWRARFASSPNEARPPRKTDWRAGQVERRRRRERRPAPRADRAQDPRYVEPRARDRRGIAAADGRDSRDQRWREPAR